MFSGLLAKRSTGTLLSQHRGHLLALLEMLMTKEVFLAILRDVFKVNASL